MSSSNPGCWGSQGHVCQQPSGLRCVDCGAPAGTLWGPHFCPDCDVKRLDKIDGSLADIASDLSSN